MGVQRCAPTDRNQAPDGVSEIQKKEIATTTVVKTSGASPILRSKLLETSGRREQREMDKLKQVLKAQDAIITNLLSKLDHLNKVSALTKSPQVKEAIAATIVTAAGLDGNRKTLIGAFYEAERECRQTIKPAADQHSTILANQEAILHTCQNIKESLAKQQEDIKDLKVQPAKTGPTYAQLTRARMPPPDQQGEIQEGALPAEEANWRTTGKRANKKDIRGKIVSKQNREKKSTPLPEAIAVRPGHGETVADILKAMRKEVDLEKTGAQISSISESRGGEILIKLKSKDAERSALEEALRANLGPRATVRNLVKLVDVEILDLDGVTTQSEVENSLREALGLSEVDLTIKAINMRQSFIGTQRATVRLKHGDALKIVEKGRIKVGWINARVRLRVKAIRCFKCLGYGHTKHECKGPDRSEVCCLCGKEGHKAISCNAPPRCAACLDIKKPTDHYPGSGKCVAYHIAMDKKKKK